MTKTLTLKLNPHLWYHKKLIYSNPDPSGLVQFKPNMFKSGFIPIVGIHPSF
jgi:hypothetical protein